MGGRRWSGDQEGLDVEKSPHTQLCSSSNSSVHGSCALHRVAGAAHYTHKTGVVHFYVCVCVYNATSCPSAVTAISRLHIKILGLRG